MTDSGRRASTRGSLVARWKSASAEIGRELAVMEQLHHSYVHLRRQEARSTLPRLTECPLLRHSRPPRRYRAPGTEMDRELPALTTGFRPIERTGQETSAWAAWLQ